MGAIFLVPSLRTTQHFLEAQLLNLVWTGRTMAQMAKYGTEGQAKNIIACTIFVCRPIKKLMVPMERLSLKDLF